MGIFFFMEEFGRCRTLLGLYFRFLQNMGIMNRIYSGRVGSAAAHSSPVGGSNAQNADAGSVSRCRLAAAGVLCKQTELKSTRSLPDRLRLLMFAARRQAVAECDAPKSNLGGGREDIFRLKRRRVRGVCSTHLAPLRW